MKLASLAVALLTGALNFTWSHFQYGLDQQRRRPKCKRSAIRKDSRIATCLMFAIMQFASMPVHSHCGPGAALVEERFHDSQTEKETWGITFPWLPRFTQNSQSREISRHTMETTIVEVVPGDGQHIWHHWGVVLSQWFSKMATSQSKSF